MKLTEMQTRRAAVDAEQRAAANDATLAEIEAKPQDRTEVRFGFWRKWDDVSDEC